MKKVFILSFVICMLVTSMIFSNALDLKTDTSFQPAGTTNLVIGKTFTFSSTGELSQWGWSGSFLNDGKVVTEGDLGWTTNTTDNAAADAPAWFQVDLGQKYDISRVILWPRQDATATGACFPVDYIVQVSDDGNNWTTIITESNQVNVGIAEHLFDFSTPKAGRYIKFTCTKRAADNNGFNLVQLAEFAVYGKAYTEPQPETFDANILFSVAVVLMFSAFCLKLLSNKTNAYI